MTGRWLLALGAAAGIVAAAAGIVAPDVRPEGDAVAWVGSRPIRRADYERALAAAAADRRGPLDDVLRRHVLDRLIDEELLVGHAQALGLPETDPRLRGEIARAMLEAVVASGDAGEPTETELRAFYAEHAAELGGGARVRAEALFFAARPTARDWGSLRAAAEPTLAPPPEGLIPLGKLADHVGSVAAAACATLPLDRPSEPLPGPGGWVVLRVRERVAAAPPAFEAVGTELRAALLRQRDDERLRRWLAERRREVGVVP